MDNEPSWLVKLTELDPLMVRGLVVSVLGLAGAFGITLTDGTTQNVLTFVLGIFGLVVAVWGRPAVTPNARVLAFVKDPYAAKGEIMPGGAAVGSDQAHEVVEAAVEDAA